MKLSKCGLIKAFFEVKSWSGYNTIFVEPSISVTITSAILLLIGIFSMSLSFI